MIRIMSPKLPVFSDLEELFSQIDTNGIYSNFGPLNSLLESRIAAYLGIDSTHVVSSANATLALEGAIATSGANLGDVWDIPAWTFTATASSVLRSGMKINFCDVDHEWRISPKNRNDYVIDVLPFGESLNLERLNTYKAIVVDAAASFDSIRNFESAFKNGNFSMILSLHATKILPAGEGGIFISNNPDWVKRFRQWTNFGFLPGVRESMIVGTNAKMSEYTAAIAIKSIENWEIDRLEWEKLTQKIIYGMSSLKLQVHTAMSKGYITPYWIVVLQDSESKRKLQEALSANSIEYRDWWSSGCHQMEAFKKSSRENLFNTDSISSRTLGLPFHLNLNDTEIMRIFAVLK